MAKNHAVLKVLSPKMILAKEVYCTESLTEKSILSKCIMVKESCCLKVYQRKSIMSEKHGGQESMVSENIAGKKHFDQKA